MPNEETTFKHMKYCYLLLLLRLVNYIITNSSFLKHDQIVFPSALKCSIIWRHVKGSFPDNSGSASSVHLLPAKSSHACLSSGACNFYLSSMELKLM